MFCRNRWIELLYSLSGHCVLMLSFVVLLWHIAVLWPEGLSVFWKSYAGLAMFLICMGICLLCIFVYSVICTSALTCNLLGCYTTAEKLYQFTLRIRQSLPVVGPTARVDFWRLSLANCRRLAGRHDEAEKIYSALLEDHKSGLIDRFTHFGFRETVMENYADLLEATERQKEALSIRSRAGWRSRVLQGKYALVCVLVVTIGYFFIGWENIQLDLLSAKCFVEAGQYEKAILSSTLVIDQDPDCIRAYGLRGISRQRLGQIGLAELDLAKVRGESTARSLQAKPDANP